MSTPAGPFDESEIDRADGVDRIDLGSLLIAGSDGVDVQVQVDEQTGNVVQATCVLKGAAVQVQPYAAPRSGGMWDEVRPQIRSSINAANGLVDEVEGEFGTELHAQVAAPDGKGLQPARFVGIDGPRWFLRAVFLGTAARPGADAARLDALVRGMVVVRGTEAMPVGSPIPMRLPNAAVAAPQMPERDPLTPFARGPEITETR